jgi:hypothetical protein
MAHSRGGRPELTEDETDAMVTKAKRLANGFMIVQVSRGQRADVTGGSEGNEGNTKHIPLFLRCVRYLLWPFSPQEKCFWIPAKVDLYRKLS